MGDGGIECEYTGIMYWFYLVLLVLCGEFFLVLGRIVASARG